MPGWTQDYFLWSERLSQCGATWRLPVATLSYQNDVTAATYHACKLELCSPVGTKPGEFWGVFVVQTLLGTKQDRHVPFTNGIA